MVGEDYYYYYYSFFRVVTESSKDNFFFFFIFYFASATPFNSFIYKSVSSQRFLDRDVIFLFRKEKKLSNHRKAFIDT